MKIIEKEINLLTGKETITEREMTSVEITQFEIDEKLRLQYLADKTQAEESKAAAQAKLAALGLTTDDLKALGLGGN